MVRRTVVCLLACMLFACALPGCSANSAGGSNGPVMHNARVRVLSVDEEAASAEVQVLERPDDLTITWNTFEAGEEGAVDFSDAGVDELPTVGADIVVSWIESAGAQSVFPLTASAWEETVAFYADLDDVHEVRITSSMLRFLGQTVDDMLADFEEVPEMALAARNDEGDLVITFTTAQLERYRADTEETLAGYRETLDASDEVSAIAVADDHATVTVTAAPELLDKPALTGTAFMGIPGACVILQALDGVEDWRVEVVVVDAETGIEVMRVALPEGSADLTTEGWLAATQ